MFCFNFKVYRTSFNCIINYTPEKVGACGEEFKAIFYTNNTQNLRNTIKVSQLSTTKIVLAKTQVGLCDHSLIRIPSLKARWFVSINTYANKKCNDVNQYEHLRNNSLFKLRITSSNGSSLLEEKFELIQWHPQNIRCLQRLNCIVWRGHKTAYIRGAFALF